MNASLGVSSPEPGSRIRLKPSAGWFAAGERFETALLGLSDGAFLWRWSRRPCFWVPPASTSLGSMEVPQT